MPDKSSNACLLGATCGSARSMDCTAQSMDPYFAQESMGRALRQGSCLHDRSVDFAYMYTTNHYTIHSNPSLVQTYYIWTDW